MTKPINNYLVGRKLKAVANQYWDAKLEDNVVPVLIINPQDAPAEVLPGFSKPTKKQTVVTAYATGQNDEAVIYTVPAGYTFYCVGIVITGGAAGYIGVKVGATQVLGNRIAANGNATYTGAPLLVATAGTQIIVDSGLGAGNVDMSIWGYLELDEVL